MGTFFSKINIRQLVIHFVASWLFVYGINTAVSLFDYRFLYTGMTLQNKVMFKDKFNLDMVVIDIAGAVGLLIAYVISSRISIKRNWFWANAVIVFLIAFGLYYFNLLDWSSLRSVFLAPGRIFSFLGVLFSIIIDCLIMVSLGCYLFFNKTIQNFIDRGVNRSNNKKAN